jgi:hypothetical protein
MHSFGAKSRKVGLDTSHLKDDTPVKVRDRCGNRELKFSGDAANDDSAHVLNIEVRYSFPPYASGASNQCE